MWPKLITVGDFFLPTYGVLVTLGFLAGIRLGTRLAARRGLPEESILNLGVYCALAGLLGAKLLMFVVDFSYYSRDPSRLFSFATLLSAGIYHGGFLAALAFAWFYVRRNRLPWLDVTDSLAPGLALGHAIGRLGCFAAGCCWGSKCDRPWAVTFTDPEANRITGVPLGVALHPAQLYEAVLTFAVAWALVRASRRPVPAGRVFGLYLVLYSAIRIATEFFRDHDQAPPFGGPLTWTQWIAAALLAGGVILLWKARSTAPARAT